MSKGLIVGMGGGASLNYKIIGGTSRPSSGGGDTLTWDGNTEGLETFGTFTKVSDVVLSKEDFANGATITANTGSVYTFTAEEMQEMCMEDGFCVVGEWALSIPYDGYNVGDGFVLPAGIYFNSVERAFVSSLTIPNYTGFGGGASVKENTIWVDTDVKITSHAFSATEPTNSVEGMVWFKVGATSVAPFNALKKNSIMVYVDGCSQYTSGAWTAKNAQIYQNGWKTLATYTIILFDGENDVTDISGGWARWSGKGASTIKTDDGVIKMTAPAAQASRSNGTFGHETAVDLTGYTTVTVTTNTIPTNSDNRSYVAVYDSSKTKLKSETLKKSTTSTVLDISDVTGACYVGFFVESYYSTASYTWDAVTISVKSVVVS